MNQHNLNLITIERRLKLFFQTLRFEASPEQKFSKKKKKKKTISPVSLFNNSTGFGAE